MMDVFSVAEMYMTPATCDYILGGKIRQEKKEGKGGNDQEKERKQDEI